MGSDRVPQTGLRWVRSLTLCHTRTDHKHTLFQNATEAGEHQGRKYELFNWNIIPKGPFPSDRDSQVVCRNRRQLYGECDDYFTPLIGSGHPISLLVFLFYLQSANSRCDPLMEVNIK